MLSVGVATFSYQQRKTDANGKRKPFFFFHAGSALLLKLQSRHYFYSFYPFETNIFS